MIESTGRFLARSIDRRSWVTLRKAGYHVTDLSRVGDGCPDLLVCADGFMCLVEVKDGEQVPSKRKLNARQREWHDACPGPVLVVTSPEDALQQLGRMR